MNPSLFILVCSSILLCRADAARWSWGHFANFKGPSEETKEQNVCLNGQCLQAWKCPENATVIQSDTACSKRDDGPWVCCVEYTDTLEMHSKDEPTLTTVSFTELFLKNSRNPYDSTSLSSNPILDISEENKENNYSSLPLPMGYRYRADIEKWGRSYTYSPKHSYTEDASSSPEEYRYNAEIVNWGKSYARSPKNSQKENVNAKPSSTDTNKSTNRTQSDKGSTTGPSSRFTEEKLRHPVTSSLRNKNNPEARYDPHRGHGWSKVTKESWDTNHDSGSSRRSAIKTTTRPRWDSRDREETSSRRTKTWEVRTTASSWEKPTKGSWDSTSNSRKSSSATPNSWTKSTTASRDRDSPSSSERTTKNQVVGTTAKTFMKPTRVSWKSTTPTRKPTSTNGRSTESLTNTKITPEYPGRQSFSTTKAPLSTRLSSRSTKRPIENLENPKRTSSTSRTNSVNRRSTTKKFSSTTPMPDINIHQCGLRQTNRDAARRGKRSDPEVVVYAGSTEIEKNRTPFQRIVGGKEAEPFSWPWVAALYRVTESGGNRFLSAGTLINEHFVLTAAHVFTPDDLRTASFVVMLGTHTAKESVAEHVVMYVLRHPDYQQRFYYNDIALLKLERPVVFNNYVMPVCLPSPSVPLMEDEELEGKKVTVMGWGDESYGGKTSRVLKEASFPIVSRESCNTSYFRVASNRFPRGITASMLCAGAPNGGKDACQGDSGGPLTTIQGGRHTQVGIVSFGYKCGDKEYPGVYTKVAPYLSWIAQNARCDDYKHDYPDYYSR
ncbi:clotting factor B [Nephila pilipes]|uniref:Clotting factor B n=1 Tax=Nephila pilipes TaxID=299642 RepID=A0A8X6PTT4_NEPPI|nr:clotting factor B [Nephila pilipes]